MERNPPADSERRARGGIRTEVVVGSPAGCPVARASAESDAHACQVSRCPSGADGGRVVGEFELRDDGESARLDAVDCEHVFATDTGDVYRFDDADCEPCPCAAVESMQIPVSAVQARHGDLHITFHAEEPGTVRDVVERLREDHDAVSVRRMRRGRGDGSEQLVLVDRNQLTDRQLEVVETAWHLGYFEDPRGASGVEVADELGISPSTFAEHLAAAQRKVLGDVLER